LYVKALRLGPAPRPATGRRQWLFGSKIKIFTQAESLHCCRKKAVIDVMCFDFREISRISLFLCLSVILCSVHCTADSALNVESFISDSQYCFAAGDGGNVFFSRNGGYLWTLDTVLNVDIRGAFAFDDGSAIVVGGACKKAPIDFLTQTIICDIFRRDSFSGNWTRSTLAAYAPTFNDINRLNGISFCNSSLGFVVGSNGGILRSQNSGIIWSLMTSGVSGTFNVVACSLVTTDSGSTQVVVNAAGDQGLLAQSLDAGVTWMRSSTIIRSSGNVTSLLWGNGTLNGLALLRGAPGGVYYTTDAGYTWSPVPLPASFQSWSPAAAAAAFAPVPYRTVLAGTDASAAASAPGRLLQSSRTVAESLSTGAPNFPWLNDSAPLPLNAILSIAAAGLGR
jgi:hypothetical protein